MDEEVSSELTEANQRAIDALEDATITLRLARRDLRARIDEVVALEATLTDTEMRKAVARFKELFGILVKERQSFERDIFGRTIALSAEPIDLDAARTEVGRLLDSLRTAGGSGGVSGQP